MKDKNESDDFNANSENDSLNNSKDSFEEMLLNLNLEDPDNYAAPEIRSNISGEISSLEEPLFVEDYLDSNRLRRNSLFLSQENLNESEEESICNNIIFNGNPDPYCIKSEVHKGSTSGGDIPFLSNKTIIPDSYSYVSKLPPITNQENRGSCVANSICCIVEYHKSKRGYNGHLSVSFIYNQRNNVHASGMSCLEGLEIAHNIGSFPNHMYPYGDSLFSDSELAEMYNISKFFRITGYKQLFSLEDILKSLVIFGPLLISVDVYNYDPIRFWRKRENSVYNNKHCMVIVGYNDKGLILRNSWGRFWNKNGYVNMSYLDFFNSKTEVWAVFDETPNLISFDFSDKSLKYLCDKFLHDCLS